ncbi:MAG TPA: RdgB/HAM1 family non-canonical purine NTP pyrophosphatase [Burkholderiaceae bacterium]|nr:RdgB/HAM1 family non-canonical purine NTP pyrophosphatase [Burkholderiaceae bacterium]
MTRRIVLASSNAGKLREFRALLAELDFEVIAQGELGIEAAEEPHLTFVENALAKARHAAVRSGLPALADDSGLCVAALGGAPGVHSARFSGSNASDESNNAELLRRLHGHAERRAHYTCVLVAVAAADDPEPLIAEARWPGTILAQPRGVGGFGYDPLFLLPELGRTAAELAPDEKNRISHRGQAMRELARRFAVWS